MSTRRIVYFIVGLLLGIFIFRYCQKPGENKELGFPIPKIEEAGSFVIENQLIVSHKANAGVSLQDTFNILYNQGESSQLTIQKVERCPCDTLSLVTFTESIFGQDDSHTIRVKRPGEAGDISLNYRVNIDNLDKELPTRNFFKYNARTKVAIFDSGLNGNAVASTNANTCPNGSWNFIDNNNNISDATNHGTMVTKLLTNNTQNILPQIYSYKVLDQNKGSLFHVMCGIRAAIENKVNFANMSLGYYGLENKMFTRYMQELNKNNIWTFVAAGNVEAPINTSRDLDTMKQKFYPAVYSNSMEKVITVSSATKSERGWDVSSNQNYSPKLVNIVVGTDSANFFFTTANGAKVSLTGSSFATPILAGKFISAVGSGTTRSKADILDSLSNTSASELAPKVQNKRILNR
jgi:hypothetical protein